MRLPSVGRGKVFHAEAEYLIILILYMYLSLSNNSNVFFFNVSQWGKHY